MDKELEEAINKIALNTASILRETMKTLQNKSYKQGLADRKVLQQEVWAVVNEDGEIVDVYTYPIKATNLVLFESEKVVKARIYY